MSLRFCPSWVNQLFRLRPAMRGVCPLRISLGLVGLLGRQPEQPDVPEQPEVGSKGIQRRKACDLSAPLLQLWLLSNDPLEGELNWQPDHAANRPGAAPGVPLVDPRGRLGAALPQRRRPPARRPASVAAP